MPESGSSQTEIDDLRLELDSANRKLAEAHKLASLGRLSAGIVHEINSPIGSILSNNDIIVRSLTKLKQILTAAETEGAVFPKRVLDTLDVIMGLAAIDKIACERIFSIVRSLKTFARVNEGELLTTNVNNLLKNTLKLTGAMFRNRVAMEADLADLPDIQCYPGLLNQAFLNIIVNGGQAIAEQGVVRVTSRLEGNHVHIAIEDSGSGIPVEVRPRIFAAGFTTKPLGEGTGLGLSITREIVEDTHGGEIYFDTELGRGTTFHIRIPVTQSNRSNA